MAWAATGLALALAQLLVVASGYLFVWQSLRSVNTRIDMTLDWPHFAFGVVGVVCCAIGMRRGGVRLGAVGLAAGFVAFAAAAVLGGVTWG